MRKLSNHLYIFQCEQYYKIGISYSVDRRLRSIKTSTPFEIKLITCYILKDIKYSSEARKVERYLHKHFNSKKKNGEWFELMDSDLEKIPQLIKESTIKERNPKIIEISVKENSGGR